MPKVVIYRGRKYRPGKYDDQNMNLISEDPADIALGFDILEPGLLIKTVPRIEIDEAYRLYRYGVYQGVTVPIIDERDGKLLIECDRQFTGPGWHWLQYGVWVNWVLPEELERIWEEKLPL